MKDIRSCSTVGDLRAALDGLADDTPIAVQKNWVTGYTLHRMDVWRAGHVGWSSPLVQIGAQVDVAAVTR